MSISHRIWSVFVILGAALALPLSTAHASPSRSVGGHPGEIDMSSHVTFQLGEIRPTERPTTWQEANTKIIELGAGYTIGELGPLKNFYVRLDGAYVTSAEETVTNPNDDLPLGTRFYGADRSGLLSATMAADFLSTPRLSFGLFLRGSLPIDINLEKFSNIATHHVSGGAHVDVWLSDRTKFLRLGYASRLFVGSGTYQDGFQHNASAALSNMFVVEAGRWVLPWRMGLRLGPHFEGDINEHVNEPYHEAYAKVSSDFVNGDRVRAMRLDFVIQPYVCITDNAALVVNYAHEIFGYDSRSTQRLTAGVRTAF